MSAGKPRKSEWSLATMPGELLTVACGAAGGLLFYALHIPGGAMSGSVVAVAILCAYGKATPLGGILRVLALSTMGVAIGSAVGPTTFSNLATYPASVALMSLCVVGMTLASAAVWRLFMNWPGPMALLSSVPGSSSYIISVSLTMGADAARVAVVQVSRVIFLVTLLPFIVVYESGGSFAVPELPVTDPIHIVLATLVFGIAAGSLLTRMKMAGGMLLGAMIASGFVHYLGWAPGRVPMWLLNGGQILLGSWVGSRFVDFDWRLFGRICIGTTAAVGAAMAVSVAFAMIASTLFGVSFGTALIAYAPGGQDAMMVLALTLGVDPIFVSAHHLARYFIINVSLPFFVAWLQRREARAKAATEGAE
jgi:membrane AbrB-like protein